MKKLMTVLLIAMVGVCFADYKSEFSFNLNDAAKIEKGLAEATAAKDTGYINLYSKLKLFAGKDAKAISYEEFKKLLNNDKENGLPQFVLMVKRFNAFIPNVLNDSEFNNSSYIKNFYSTSGLVMKTLGHKVWREKFINLDTFDVLGKDYKIANRFLFTYKNYYKKFTAEEIKADTVLMKRAWYPNISKSEEWKNLMVQVELINKSVQ